MAPLHNISLTQADVVHVTAKALPVDALRLVIAEHGCRAIAADIATPVIAAHFILTVRDTDLLDAPINEDVRIPAATPIGSQGAAILEEDLAPFAPDHGVSLADRHLTVAPTAALPLADIVLAFSPSGAQSAAATATVIAALLAGTGRHAFPLTGVRIELRPLGLGGLAIVKAQGLVPAALLLTLVDHGLAVHIPENPLVTPEHHIVFAAPLVGHVPAGPLPLAQTVEALLPHRADPATSATTIGAAFHTSAIG